MSVVFAVLQHSVSVCDDGGFAIRMETSPSIHLDRIIYRNFAIRPATTTSFVVCVGFIGLDRFLDRMECIVEQCGVSTLFPRIPQPSS